MNGHRMVRRLSAARALVAGAAFLASASSPFTAAFAQGPTEDAMAVPRLRPADGGPLALPRPLTAALARQAREAFRSPDAPLDGLRAAGGVAAQIAGVVLADRLLGLGARAGAGELAAWLDQYADLADAGQIHALLLTRLPRGEAPPPPSALPVFTPAPGGDEVELAGAAVRRNPALDRAVREAARAGQAERALRLIARTRGLGPEYGALLRAEVARALFSAGRDAEALALAERAAAGARGAVGLPAYVAGLAAWRLGRIETARQSFEAAWRAPLAPPAQKAAAAFWAARAGLLLHGTHGPWMRRAAQEPRSFYGLLARETLGQPITTGQPYEDETLSQADLDAVAASPRGARALALLQAEQPARAAAELRLLFAETRERPGYGRSVLLVARAAGLDGLVGELGAVLQPRAVHLPRAPLAPTGGFRIEPSLVYALARLESNFDAGAVSPAGALGLMQLMPGTARVVAEGGRPLLHDPATNLQLGQRYLLRLGAAERVGPDLIRVLAAYNAGPGTYARWMETMAPEEDPLLFIEALPGEETRAYVPRVLAYSWLYAAHFHRRAASLAELAAGRWPALPVRATPLRAPLASGGGLRLH